MRFVVAGGAGFCGSHAVDRLLAEGHEVHAVDDLSGGSLANLADARRHERFTFHHVDVRAPELEALLGRVRPDVVMHTTWPGHPAAVLADPLYAGDVALLGLLSVLEAARPLPGVRCVVATSLPAAVGDAPAGLHDVLADAAARVVEVHPRLYGTDVVGVALPALYGPRQAPGRADGPGPVVARFIDDALTGRTSVFDASPDHSLDLLHVDEAVDAMVRAAGDAPAAGTVVPVGSGRPVTLRALHKAVNRAARTKVGATEGPRRVGAGVRPPVDPGVARRALGWVPFADLDEGLARVVAWYRNAGGA